LSPRSRSLRPTLPGAALHACTVVTRRYLAHARVLAESFREHHPGAAFSVLVVDDVDGSVQPAQEPFEALDPDAVGMDPREHRRMAAMYEPGGLVSATRSTGLRHLLDRGAAAAVYIDADVEVFDSLEPAAASAREGRVVLTPHVTRPAPPEYERAFLTSGIYNGGFLAVGAGARPFLDWLANRVARDCIRAPEQGLVFGQRWLEFVPGLFDHHVLRDPGCNLMSWNLHEREVVWTGERYLVDGRPLRFFHFCGGFDPHRPERLATQPDVPWMDLAATGAVRRLCDRYAERLLAAGYDEATATEHGYTTLADGTEIDRIGRAAYRHGLLAAERDSLPEPPNPFWPGEEEAFLGWLAAPNGRRAAVSPYLQALWEAREDLRTAFPAVPGDDTPRYLDWVHGETANAASIPHGVLDGAR
jgi:hypothetical protein